MLQINVRNHQNATTVALRGVMDEADGPDLQDQLEFLVKFDNKLNLLFDCTRLVSSTSAVWDNLHNIFLRMSYLREITFCGANANVKKVISRSRINEFSQFSDNYQALLDELHPETEPEEETETASNAE